MLVFDSTRAALAATNAGGDVVLAGLLCAAAIIDIRTYRLPNWLTVGGTLLGIAWSLLPGGTDLTHSLLGAVTGLVALIPFYALRIMGAGDVKLMAAVGAFLGVPELFPAMIFTFIAGGLMAVGFAAWRRSLSRTLLNARDLVEMTALAAVHGERPFLDAVSSTGKLPYGLCVCVGTLGWLVALPFLA